MTKGQVAHKLGWKQVWVEDMDRHGVQVWRPPYPTEMPWGMRLPDWENSLDAQVRDIWPHIYKNDMDYIIDEMRDALSHGENPAQACWKAVREVMGVKE